MPFYHGDETIIHRLHRWKFLNATNRLAGLEYIDSGNTAVAYTFLPRDIGRRAYDMDSKTLWDITDVVAGVPTWVEANVNISGKEDVSNKVTNISGSSTDTQYPSAKLLYDQLALKALNLLTGFSASAGTVAATDTVLQAFNKIVGNLALKLTAGDYGTQECFPIAISDTATALATGTVALTFHFPYAFNLTKVKAGVNVASTSGIPTFDVKKNGTSVFSTKVTIDTNETHSSTAATAAVLTSTLLAVSSADAFTFSIDVAGTGTKQAVIYLCGYATGAA